MEILKLSQQLAREKVPPVLEPTRRRTTSLKKEKAARRRTQPLKGAGLSMQPFRINKVDLFHIWRPQRFPGLLLPQQWPSLLTSAALTPFLLSQYCGGLDPFPILTFLPVPEQTGMFLPPSHVFAYVQNKPTSTSRPLTPFRKVLTDRDGDTVSFSHFVLLSPLLASLISQLKGAHCPSPVPHIDRSSPFESVSFSPLFPVLPFKIYHFQWHISTRLSLNWWPTNDHHLCFLEEKANENFSGSSTKRR